MSDRKPEETKELSSTDLHSATYNLFILVLTVFSLALMVLLLWPRLHPATQVTLQFIDTLICLIFLGDFISNLQRAPNRKAYFFKQGGWLDLLGSIPSIPGIPWTAVLRLARLGRLARIMRFLRAKDSQEIWEGFKADRAQSALMVTIFVAIVVMTVSSVVVLQVEANVDGANIKTGGDAFWWSFVTVTTVGYGDRYPVTGLGRLMAMILMIVGVGIFGVLTSYLSSAFLGPSEEEEEIDSKVHEFEDDFEHLRKEMETIKQMLKELKEQK